MKDYYRVLGVRREASALQIKKAYRRLIKLCHPDVNPSPSAVEQTSELNEAYGVLSDAEARMSYDMSLKVGESARRESRPGSAAPGAGGAAESPMESETRFCCDRCGAVDSTLRVAATWRVQSFITYGKKTPTTQILCGRCRVKESLSANAYTICLGWWSLLGFIWTVEALWNNACGGEQPVESNAALLNALSAQLDRDGRPQEAYEAMQAAFVLKPDPLTQETLERLHLRGGGPRQRAFWEEFRSLELHPLCYHAPLAAVLVLLLCLVHTTLNGGGHAGGSRTPWESAPSHGPVPTVKPTP